MIQWFLCIFGGMMKIFQSCQVTWFPCKLFYFQLTQRTRQDNNIDYSHCAVLFDEHLSDCLRIFSNLIIK